MQTAGHVAGAAYYYKNANPRALGVSIHPEYGGWFAFRAVLAFPAIQLDELQQTLPIDIVTQDKQWQLLDSFTNDWRSFAYRDIVPVKAKYSPIQQKYFATVPADRFFLLENFLQDEDEAFVVGNGILSLDSTKSRVI